jgi:Ser/Thr protein kinase RdoA (MazF antagonist)
MPDGADEVPLLAAFRLIPLERPFSHQREATMWAVRWRDRDTVIRRLDPAAQLLGGEDEVLADRSWIHGQLGRLVGLGAPVPEPLPVFDGHSVMSIGGTVWEALSWLPGEPVGWSHQPDLGQVGAFLARYHDLSVRVAADRQRLGVIPVAEVAGVIRDAPWAAMTDDEVAVDRLLGLTDLLEEELRRSDFDREGAALIHGDPTTMNVLATGDPPVPTALIDFGAAYVEVDASADVAFGLWQAGRPSFEATMLDPERTGALVAGYARERPLDRWHTQVIPVFIVGRGLQMIAKRARAGIPALASLERAEWVATHLALLREVVAAAAG